MHLMWCLVFFTAKYNFVVSAFHVKDCFNDLVDALSRNKQSYFLSNYLEALRTPTTIPQALVNLLITAKPDWTSPDWTILWNNIFTQH